jgi:hypothetical protein
MASERLIIKCGGGNQPLVAVIIPGVCMYVIRASALNTAGLAAQIHIINRRSCACGETVLPSLSNGLGGGNQSARAPFVTCPLARRWYRSVTLVVCRLLLVNLITSAVIAGGGRPVMVNDAALWRRRGELMLSWRRLAK